MSFTIVTESFGIDPFATSCVVEVSAFESGSPSISTVVLRVTKF